MQTDQPQARRVTARTIIFALSAATLVFLTTIIVVLITYTAISTPSTLDPSLSEFAICGPIVFWRVFWHIAWAANFVPISLDAMVHPSERPAGYTRVRIYAFHVAMAWLPLGAILLTVMRTPCATAAPDTWEGAVVDLLYTGLPAFVGIALCALISAIVRRVRARRAAAIAVAPAQVSEKVEVVFTDSKIADSKV